MADVLWRSWGWLLALSFGSTAAALAVDTGDAGHVAGAAILMLAYFKARLILSHYLGLAEAPFWLRGFNLAIGLFMALLLALYLIPGL
ncbi:cytochrome C oxidase subunit IV family protein [Hoeflea sp. TYP-13]